MRAGRRAYSGALFPAASTEVVMAERWNSMPHFVASLRDTALSTSRIPVLGFNPRIVTRNQPRRVRAVNETAISRVSSAPKDLGALDSCDKHRNEAWLRHASAAPFLTPQASR
jgi:hypothetical protein